MTDTEDSQVSNAIVSLLEPAEYRTWRIERRQRLQILVVVLPAVCAIVLMAIRNTSTKSDLYDTYSPVSRLMHLMGEPIVLITLFGVSLFGLAMMYLQTGFKRNSREQMALGGYYDELNSLRRQLEITKNDSIEIRKVTDQLANTGTLATPSALNPRAEADLVDEIEGRIRRLATENVIDELKATALEQVSKERWLVDVSNRFQDSFSRLSKEVQALANRGNLNLSLGTATTIVGLMLLGYFVILASRDITAPTGLLVRFIPRLSLVAFIELFAYFFLRLYKSSLAEIKYFQNEITNMELKAVSVFVAAQMATPEALERTIDAFANVERNRILEKGQATVELRKTELEMNEVKDGLKEVIHLVKLASKGTGG